MAQNEYNAIGQLRKQKLDNGNQETVYGYHPRGWLSSGVSNEFSIALDYENGAEGQWNGNISRQRWGAGNNLPNSYHYRYDKQNRLISGISSQGKNEQEIGYDKMGNILSLQRTSSASFVEDNLNYVYAGNSLVSVTDSSGGVTGGFQLPGTTNYSYDINGNMTSRVNGSHVGNNINVISYNVLNLPKRMQLGSGQTLSYVYDGAGKKLRKEYGGGITDYVDGIHYENGSIAFFQTETGRAINNGNGYVYEYNLKDHLGNVRYSFDYSGGIRKTQSDDYYPFGLRIGSLVTSPENKYLYNGKELQEQTGQYDYGARFYDPVIGRFNTIDPLSDQRVWVSPFNYGQNNPINRNDPTGALDDWVMDEDKNPHWDPNVTSVNDKDLKKGDTYIGKSAEYTATNGYGVELNSDGTWNYQIRQPSNDLPYLQSVDAFKDAISANMPGLKLAEGIAVGTAALASGEVAGGEAAGNFLMGQASRKSEFLSGLAEYVTNKASSFFKGATFTQKVIQQTSNAADIGHAFPKSVEGFSTQFGKWFNKVGNDGKMYEWLTMPGSYGGRTGTFEFIKDANGLINHRYLNVP